VVAYKIDAELIFVDKIAANLVLEHKIAVDGVIEHKIEVPLGLLIRLLLYL
jgi:hypothetical protein